VTDEREDKQDIAEVLVHYATGIDTRDWAPFRTCWTDDVVVEYDGIGTWHGGEEITASMDTSHAAMGRTMHQLSNWSSRLMVMRRRLVPT
jgi:hypothetical protein